MTGENNHNSENWLLYEGSKPELQVLYIPCATNKCSEHCESEVYATDSEVIYN